ncbi:Ribonuclease H domain [Arabidopsis suecica]|uniref:Ribonuclease H domain n=1 Tax=Arabidopsis suecica TaxID=45249 RepID=A0A8T2CGE0_ARASU|nr:Ribonuclease H domain [Arabidopsis suecica]
MMADDDLLPPGGGSALDCFLRLDQNSVDSFDNLSTLFLKQYSVLIECGTSDANLWSLAQQPNELLRDFLATLTLARVEGITDVATTIHDALHRASDFATHEEEMELLAKRHQPTKQVARAEKAQAGPLILKKTNQSGTYTHHEGRAFGHHTSKCQSLKAKLAAKDLTGELGTNITLNDLEPEKGQREQADAARDPEPRNHEAPKRTRGTPDDNRDGTRQKMNIDMSQVSPTPRPVLGFAGETLMTLGTIQLPVRAGGVTKIVDFSVTDQPTIYHRTSSETPSPSPKPRNEEAWEEKKPTSDHVVSICLNDERPEQCVEIGCDLNEEIKAELILFLKENINTFAYNVMPFRLKKAGATYQRLVNRMFAEQLTKTMEVYIDDMLVKSLEENDHVAYLRDCFRQLNLHNMKFNPAKCSFAVKSGEFLGYLVTHCGIEVNPKQIDALLNMALLQNKHETFTDAETRYPQTEKLALAVVMSARKLRPYFQSHSIVVIAPILLRAILHSPSQSGRLAKWAVELSEYAIEYRNKTCAKSQVLADFIIELPPENTRESPPDAIWILHIDGLKINKLRAFCDSQLVAYQFNGEYTARDERMEAYLALTQDLTKLFGEFELTRIRRGENPSADALAALASTSDSNLRRVTPVEFIEKQSIESSSEDRVLTARESRNFEEILAEPNDLQVEENTEAEIPSYRLGVPSRSPRGTLPVASGYPLSRLGVPSPSPRGTSQSPPGTLSVTSGYPSTALVRGTCHTVALSRADCTSCSEVKSLGSPEATSAESPEVECAISPEVESSRSSEAKSSEPPKAKRTRSPEVKSSVTRGKDLVNIHL